MVSLEEVSFSITDSMQCEVTLESVGGINSLERTLGTSFSKGVANKADVIEEKRKKYGEYMVLVTNIYIVYIYIYLWIARSDSVNCEIPRSATIPCSETRQKRFMSTILSSACFLI